MLSFHREFHRCLLEFREMPGNCWKSVNFPTWVQKKKANNKLRIFRFLPNLVENIRTRKPWFGLVSVLSRTSSSPEINLAAAANSSKRTVRESRKATNALLRFARVCASRALPRPMLGLTQLSNYLTLKGSFSAVSKPNFASKYALESSRRGCGKLRKIVKILLCEIWVRT